MYTVGEKVVHPMHGAGVISEITEERMSGKLERYYVFSAPLSGLTLKIPVANSGAVGLRRLISRQQLAETLASLREIEEDMTENWNHRYRENMGRIKSGEVREVARVVKGLMHRDASRGLSTVERKMLRSAKQILLSEMMLVEDLSYWPSKENNDMGIWNTVQKWQGKSVPPCSMIVAAAGSSCRMGGQDKLFAPLAGVPVLTRTLRAIDRAELVSEIVVAAQEERMEAVADLCAAAALHKKVKVVKGGASRTESVLAAALECDPRAELIAIHDGARPLVRPEMIDEMIRAGWQTQAAAPSTPVTDTVKVADDDRWVASTPDRSTLYAVQTPQVFQANILKAALQAALASGEPVTDDCAAVERLGKRVWLAEGDAENIKITTPVNLVIAEALLRQREDGR